MTDRVKDAIMEATKMTNGPTSREVFEQAVKDELNGTPNAHHPVQFETFACVMVRCTLCHAAVPEDHRDAHRQWHNTHVRIHEEIAESAVRRR